MHSNPFAKEIFEKVVKPSINQLSFDTDGVITFVDYYRQLADIQWIDSRTQEVMSAKNVTIPRDGNGIYRQSLQVGDKIKVGFRQGDHAQPYIAMIYTSDSTKADFYSRGGAGIPRGLGY